MLQDIIVTTLVNGSVYAMLALGFSLVFGVARIVNIAHTAFYMLAAYAFYTLFAKAGVPGVAAGVLAVALVTAAALACYRAVIQPVRQHESAVLIATIALALIVQESLLYAFGGHYLGVPSTLEGAFRVAGASVPWQRVLIFLVGAAALVGMWALLYRTRLGLAIRSAASDLEIASLLGMNVHRVTAAAAVLAAALAALAGVIVAPVFVVDPFMWLAPLVIMLAIVVVGGLGSLGGSVLAAFLIALVEALTVFAVPAGAFLKGAVALSIMIVVLWLRPEGLFGVAYEEER